MNVYFGENYWGCRGERAEEEPGKEIRLGTVLTWEGMQWRIPAVYLFREGLAADFCGRTEQVYSGRRDFRVELQVDGADAPRRMGCGTSWYPETYLTQEEARTSGADWAEELLMETYGLERESGWIFWRQYFAWPEKEGQKPPASLAFTFVRDPYTVHGPHFQTGAGTETEQITFLHPATGRPHTLTVLGQEPALLPAGAFLEKAGIERFPEHYTVLHYRVEPRLSDAEGLQVCDCAGGDPPVRREETGAAAASIAVIGGADGPTSFFVAGKQKGSEEDPERRCAYSSLRYTPAETVEWRLAYQVDDGIQKTVRVTL